MNYSKLNEVYTSMLYECVNELQDSKDDIEDLSNIDELTEENTTTIEENTDENQTESLNDADTEHELTSESDELSDETSDNEDNDGWPDGVIDLCDELTYQFDGFAYELKNCVRGSFTDANTPEELANYLENLKSEIESVVNQLREM
jgi:hypothetical protein